MNRITLKPRILLFIILIFSVCAVNALTLNPLIEAPDGHTLINQKPLLFNEQIIFVTEQNDDYTLWAYDLSDHSYTTLHTFEDYFYPKFYVIGDYFYFKDGFDPNILWQSDGTVDGMMPRAGTMLYQTPLYQRGDLIFARGGSEGGSFIAIGEQGIAEYIGQLTPLNPDTPGVEFACGFGIQDVIYFNQSANGQRTLIRRKPGSGSGFVDYTPELPQGFNLHQDLVWQYEDTCFYHIDTYDLGDILVIPEQGDHYFLGAQLGYSEVNYLTQFKDHYYMMANDENHKSHIVKLSSDLNTVVKQVEFDSFGVVSLTVSDDYLIGYTRTGGNASPPAWKSGYFDENLNEISGLGGPFTDVPQIYPRDGGETVVINHNNNGLNLKTLTTDITNQSPGLDLNQNELNYVITDKDESETYVLVKDLRSGQSSIKTLDALPDMGSLSVGNWYDPAYKNQGMTIVEGRRDDNSRYLFITMYLFRDGQPLWLAGVGELNYPQTQLTIEMTEYNGIGLFEVDTVPNAEKFGELELTMSACHQVMVSLTSIDGPSWVVEMQRMVNNDINHRCKD